MLEEFFATLAEDTFAYVRNVCHTLILTVPKAIVHCQIKRAQQSLLESLYAYITEMTSFETETLMDEEPESMQRRAAARKVRGQGLGFTCCGASLRAFSSRRLWMGNRRAARPPARCGVGFWATVCECP